MKLSIVIITFNEESNIRRTLESVRPLVGRTGEIIIVDNGSTDRTLDIAREFGARIFVEEWKGFAEQKNSAIEKATCDWVLSLDADEALEPALVAEMLRLFAVLEDTSAHVPLHEDDLHWGLGKGTCGFTIPRKNYFLGRWIKHAGFWPDRKLRLFRRGLGRFTERPVHEIVQVDGPVGRLQNALSHQAYPTLSSYLATMNRYSSLGAEIAFSKGRRHFSLTSIVLRPVATFISMYLLRMGFLDGREGLLLCLYHSTYVSWKYSKAWELAQQVSLQPADDLAGQNPNTPSRDHGKEAQEANSRNPA